MATLYQGRHRRQFDGGPLAYQNCVPTSLADAADQSTRGVVDLTGSAVRELVDVDEETNPRTPGWSLVDADLAASRLAIAFAVAGGTWDTLRALRAAGRGIILQGDSEVFTAGCSGTFDGDHCVYLPPLDHSDGRWRLGDPLCSDWRWESEATLREYAGRFAGDGLARFGYTAPIPEENAMQTFTILPGATIGTLTVPGAGHYYLRLADGTLHGPLKAGWGKPLAFGPVRLLEPIQGGAPGADRATGYVVGDEAAFLLAADVIFAAVPSPTEAAQRAVAAVLDDLGAAIDAEIAERRP